MAVKAKKQIESGHDVNEAPESSDWIFRSRL